MAQPTVGFSVAQITEFQINRGVPGREQAAYQRVLQSYWIFGPNGAFYFYPLDYYQAGLPPFTGNYQVQGSKAVFRATFNVSFGYTGSNSGLVTGEIDFSSGQPLLTMRWVHGAISAAVINGTDFGASATSDYLIRAVLRRAW
jgi:hypothetical protein